MSIKQIILLGLASTATAVATRPIYYNSSCRVLPGDAAWPNPVQWASLNKTVSGHLIASVPEASVCHNSPFNNYNAAACAVLQSTWNETESPSQLVSHTRHAMRLSNVSAALVHLQGFSAKVSRTTPAFRTPRNPSPANWGRMPVTW